MAATLRNCIGGEWVESSATDVLELTNPATGESLGRVPLSGARDVDQAVAAAQAAFLKWREVPPVVRARYLFKLKALLEQHFDEIAATVTRENGKTLDEAKGSLRRGIENVEHACGIPTLMMGRTLEDVAAGIDCEYVRQPLGVFAAVTPFNFPAMVPCWFWPYAIATGNTFILKPSEQVPLSPTRIVELAHEAGIPAGVLNLVHGAKDVVNALLAHPGIAGVSFVGSSPVAKHVYQEAAKHGKRVQALGGAKNHVVVMPDADLDRTVANVSESLFGCAGQRCLAGSVVVAAGKAYEPLRDRLLSAAKNLRLGYGLDAGVSMGPVVSARHKERVLWYVEAGRKEGAALLLDGRAPTVDRYPRGHFVGPTVFDGVRPDMTIGKEEIFGPVASVTRAGDLSEAIDLIQRSGFANATSIFTTSGRAAREFRYRVGVSMIGVNIGVAAPMAFFPFGGTKGSFFGDLKAHGQDAVEFYTDKKVVISRW
ncbi:MAG TPA: CoA-acylating methylmalonate-semialdehyde dehydrogenase [Gemmatimonadales bacterium]|jgi:malonate-semialdehyde dehydrogenase (acetylating)/methylmalonate-semialdehyde dehydrogenase|nr:CoA-acylating methylmalonate-semialdehyde dehydrogenase [Gemmatimonadales bacterium]